MASQVALMVRNLPANAGDIRDVACIPGLGRSPGEGHGNRFHYSSLENLTDRQSMGSQGVGLHWNDLARMQTIIDEIFQKC